MAPDGRRLPDNLTNRHIGGTGSVCTQVANRRLTNSPHGCLLWFVWCRGDILRGVVARSGRGLSPATNPGNVAARPVAKIDRGLMQGSFVAAAQSSRLVAVTVAATAKVATDRYVHRERATTPRPGLMLLTTAIPLHPESIRGWNPSKFGTCSIVISARTLSKSTPGTVVPHSVLRRLNAQGPLHSLSLYGERERLSSLDQSRCCQPASVRHIRRARSSDSSNSPKRSFFTPSESRSFARVKTAPAARGSSTCPWRLRHFPSWSSAMTCR